LLVIGLLYRDIFIPLVWKYLEEKGNSNSKERLDLITKLQCWWKSSGVKMPQLYIAGDREFIGYHWLRGLEKREIKFVMRIRANSKIELWYRGKIKDRKLGLKVLTRYLSWKQIDRVEAVLMSDYIVKLSAFKNDIYATKSIFIKGCELLLDKVFFFSEFCIEFLRVSEWVANKLNHLDYENYVLKKSIVQ
jgi:hypothetical protein